MSVQEQKPVNDSSSPPQQVTALNQEPVLAPSNEDKEPSPSGSTVFKPPRKSKKGTLRVLLIVLVLAVLGVAGYFLLNKVKVKDSGDDGVLVYWGLWEDEEIMQEVISEWEKNNPGTKIEYIRQQKEEYRQRLQSALSRGEGPDIFRFHNTWVPMLQKELASLPSSVMSAAEFEETFYPVAVSDLRSGADFYGLPLAIDTLALFYNEDIFRTARKEPPQNWLELRNLASDLTVRDSQGQVQVAGIAMGGVENIDHWSDVLGLMMLQNGVDLRKPRGNLAEDALLFYSYFLRRDKGWNPNFPNSTEAFAVERAAMFFGFSWDVFEIQRINKDLNFKVVPVPQLPERKEVAWASYWVEGVSERSSKQEKAWEFLKFLTEKETMRKLYQAQVASRGFFGEPYSRKDLADEASDNPLLAPFLKQASFAQSWYLCSRTFDNGLNEGMIDYYKNAVNKVNESGNAKEALETAISGIAQVASRWKLP